MGLALSSWRSVGAPGEAYPDWVRALEGKSGVYVLRLRASGEVVYVGESHTGRLRRTLVRHLQAWARRKQHWAGMSGKNDPGVIYPRARVEVAVAVVSAARAVAEQDRLILSLSPRDNRQGILPHVEVDASGLPALPDDFDW